MKHTRFWWYKNAGAATQRDREAGLVFCLGTRIENKGQEFTSSVSLFIFKSVKAFFGLLSYRGNYRRDA